MNADDIRAAGLQQGQLLDLASYYKDEPASRGISCWRDRDRGRLHC